MDSDTELEGVREALDYYNTITHSPLCVSDGTSSTSSLEANNIDVPGIIIMYDTEPVQSRQDSPILQDFDRCDVIFSDILEVVENSKRKRLESAERRSRMNDTQKSMLYHCDEIEFGTENRGYSEVGESSSERPSGAWSRNQYQHDGKEFNDYRGDDNEKDRFQSKRSGDEERNGISMAAADDCKESSNEPRNGYESTAVDRVRADGNRSADNTKTQEQLYFASRRVAKRASRGWVALHYVALFRAIFAKSFSLLPICCLHLAFYTYSQFAFLLYSIPDE